MAIVKRKSVKVKVRSAQRHAVPLFNRELSRLDYNSRILEKALDGSVPLLERLRFLAYCSRNLDEFFMVRVGATRDLLDAGLSERTPDGLLPAEQMSAIRTRTRELIEAMYECLEGSIMPALRGAQIVIHSWRDLEDAQRQKLREEFDASIGPLLTPLAVDPGHPFPFLSNVGLNVAASVESPSGNEHLVFMRIPEALPRFLRLSPNTFLPIGSLIMGNLERLFPAFRMTSTVLFRVIRNTELSVDSDDYDDLRDFMEAELRRRERKQVVCLEIAAAADETIVQAIVRGAGISPEDVYRVDGFLKISDLAEIADLAEAPSLTYDRFSSRVISPTPAGSDLFSAIRERDLLLHRPYDSFETVTRLLTEAAHDPDVLAVKQTLYQTDDQATVIEQLVRASRNGKQVTVVVELQARFEERRNLALAAQLQDAGVQVVYGHVGLQSHAKLCLIVRREEGRTRRYVHLSTGNYDAAAARAYTDLDLLTADEDFGHDASLLMNVLTGFSSANVAEVKEQEGARPPWRRFIVAPFDYSSALFSKIERETAHALAGRPARIAAKLNSLVDSRVIAALYRASDAGVKIDLVVRAICSLVPRENIRVISIVDRFLEHSRIIRFENAGDVEVFLSSGDWMPRNLHRRVEVMVPLLDDVVRSQVDSILQRSLDDRASSWELQPSGRWAPLRGGLSSQGLLLEQATSSLAPVARSERRSKGGRSRR